MSNFDPQAFLDATQNEVNSKRPPVPENNADSPDGLYLALIGEITTRSGEKDGKPWLQMQVPLKLQLGAQTQAALNSGPESQLTDRVFINLTPSGTIDNAPGKNARQRAYREATGLNTPGFSWRQLSGKMVKVRVKHDLYEGNIQENIAGIFPA